MQCYECRPQAESSANNTLERPLKRRKSRGSRGSKNKRKGDGGGEETTPKRQSREYRDAIISMRRDSKKKPPDPGEKAAEAVTEAADQPKEVNIQVSSAKKFAGKSVRTISVNTAEIHDSSEFLLINEQKWLKNDKPTYYG